MEPQQDSQPAQPPKVYSPPPTPPTPTGETVVIAVRKELDERLNNPPKSLTDVINSIVKEKLESQDKLLDERVKSRKTLFTLLSVTWSVFAIAIIIFFGIRAEEIPKTIHDKLEDNGVNNAITNILSAGANAETNLATFSNTLVILSGKLAGQTNAFTDFLSANIKVVNAIAQDRLNVFTNKSLAFDMRVNDLNKMLETDSNLMRRVETELGKIDAEKNNLVYKDAIKAIYDNVSALSNSIENLKSYTLKNTFYVQQITNSEGGKVDLDYEPLPQTLCVIDTDVPSIIGFDSFKINGRSITLTNATFHEYLGHLKHGTVRAEYKIKLPP